MKLWEIVWGSGRGEPWKFLKIIWILGLAISQWSFITAAQNLRHNEFVDTNLWVGHAYIFKLFLGKESKGDAI